MYYFPHLFFVGTGWEKDKMKGKQNRLLFVHQNTNQSFKYLVT